MAKRIILALSAITLVTPAAAQLAMPSLVPAVGGVVDGVVPRMLDPVTRLARDAARLAQVRLDRLSDFVRENRATVERDDAGAPARRGVVLIVEADAAALDAARARGFKLIETGTIDGTGIGFARMEVPAKASLAGAVRDLRKRLPKYEVTADQLYFPGGTAGGAASAAPAVGTARVGLIDGGTSTRVVEARGFATGAPAASPHGSAVAGILARTGAGKLYSADVYGKDPAGGNALAVARAIGWMVEMRVPVVNISLVGPSNPIVARSIMVAQARGIAIVAAVGNDGPAAPPGYPASYPGVIAVTGVDAKRRPLIEAGRPLHLNYAAPGELPGLRGTSFAAPFVAARLAVLGGSIASLDKEAIDLGPRGPDKQFGRGLVCGNCAP